MRSRGRLGWGVFGVLLLASLSFRAIYYFLGVWPALLIAVAVGLIVASALWARENSRATRDRLVQATNLADLPEPSAVPAVLARLAELRDAGGISYAQYEESRQRLVDASGMAPPTPPSSGRR